MRLRRLAVLSIPIPLMQRPGTGRQGYLPATAPPMRTIFTGGDSLRQKPDGRGKSRRATEMNTGRVIIGDLPGQEPVYIPAVLCKTMKSLYMGEGRG